MSVEKSPKALRILQIIAGLIAIGLSVFVIVSSPNAAASFLETILAITLLVIGLERIGIGIIAKTMASRTRWASIGLGVLAVILAIVAILYPGSTIAVILLILAVALLIIGISRGFSRGYLQRDIEVQQIRYDRHWCFINNRSYYDYSLTIIWFFPGIANPWSNFAAKWYREYYFRCDGQNRASIVKILEICNIT
jgi:uncharacterized membrane protein HdeD (DUF308 family)